MNGTDTSGVRGRLPPPPAFLQEHARRRKTRVQRAIELVLLAYPHLRKSMRAKGDMFSAVTPAFFIGLWCTDGRFRAEIWLHDTTKIGPKAMNLSWDAGELKLHSFAPGDWNERLMAELQVTKIDFPHKDATMKSLFSSHAPPRC